MKFLTLILEKSLEVTLQKPIDGFNFIALFAGPDPPEQREIASVAYFKGNFYYLGGYNTFKDDWTNQVDVRRSNESPCNN